jgi:hypothetical protein
MSRVIRLGIIVGGGSRRTDNRARGNAGRNRAIPVIRISSAIHGRIRSATVNIRRIANGDVARGAARRDVTPCPDGNPAARSSPDSSTAARTYGGGATRRPAHGRTPTRTDRSATAQGAAYRGAAGGPACDPASHWSANGATTTWATNAAHTTTAAIETAAASKTSGAGAASETSSSGASA